MPISDQSSLSFCYNPVTGNKVEKQIKMWKINDRMLTRGLNLIISKYWIYVLYRRSYIVILSSYYIISYHCDFVCKNCNGLTTVHQLSQFCLYQTVNVSITVMSIPDCLPTKTVMSILDRLPTTII